MESLPIRFYRLEFAKRAEWRRDEEERRFLDRLKDRDDKEKKRENDRERETDELMDIVVSALATDAEIADFSIKLDTYDAATVEALMENEQQLEHVRADLRIMLDKAYVLPDGRRVFKTEDGMRVFDEHGKEVADFDPAEIEDSRTRWETYKAHVQREQALTDERDQLHDYQDALDKARDRLDDEGLTKEELDDLEKRLEDKMPDAVRRKLPKDNDAALGADAEHGAQPASFRPAGKLDMPAL